MSDQCIDEKNRCTSDFITKKLWIIEFELRNSSKGCAVVKASNPNEASKILISEGLHNGNPIDYIIYRIEEIVPSPDSMLICEQINDKV